MKVILPFIVALSLFIGLFSNSGAQTILYERNYSDKDTVERKIGPNRRHFFAGILGAGFILGPSANGLPMQYGLSGYYNAGILYKFKINNYVAIGGDVNFRRNWFVLRQDSSRYFPSPVLNESSRFIVSNVNFNVFFRFNFARLRGNVIGKYIDVGAGFDVPISPKYSTFDKNQANGQTVEVTYGNLGYFAPVNGTAFLRAGWGHFAIRCQYRFTDLFKQDKVPNWGLPAVQLGFEVGLY